MKAHIISRKRIWMSFIAIVILTFFCILIVYPAIPDNFPGSSFFNRFVPKLGLDLQGGTHLVYQADTSQIDNADIESAMEGVREVVERRVNTFGIAEPLVQTSSNNRLIIELAGIFDIKEAIRQIGETPLLEFKEQNPAYVAEPQLTPDQQTELDTYNSDALKRAKDLMSQLQAGADFATLAGEHTEDPGSQTTGGSLDYNPRGVFVPEFEQAIWEDLTIGQTTTEPVKTAFGYHIIKLEDKRGEGDTEEALARHILIKTKSAYDFVQPSDQWMLTDLTGKNLTRAEVLFDPQTNEPQVGLVFDSEGKDLFGEITERNLGQPVAIFLDGVAISIPTVQAKITQGEAVITGNFTLPDAKLLAQRLNAGALPIPIELISQQTVGPTLGKISLQKSLVAGMIGLIMIALFMIAFYRLPGLLAVIALIIYSIVALVIFEVWPVTLTLAGVAGFILSVGMAVDANVLIFERMREELRLGKPLSSAVE
ncbi:MAG: protein translocase subunit SecD, partial [Candidatus Komeilibacteria bacterium]